jgi:hypothetical protein
VTDDIQARFEDMERRLAALEAVRREPAAETAPKVWVMAEWLQPLDEMFKSGNPARALTEADRIRAQAYAASSTTQLEELHAYLGRVPVQYPKLGSVMLAINQNLATMRGIPRGPERRTDLRPFPASQARPPTDGSVTATGDGAGDAGEN